MNYKGIKIIAIRPTKGCWDKHLKILTKGQLYQFYADYDIDVEKDTVKSKSILPEYFFSREEPAISVSAIVGKNGTGKSTLVELLFKAINNIAIASGRISADLTKVLGLHVDLYYDNGTVHKVSLAYGKVLVQQYDRLKGTARPARSTAIKLPEFFYTVAVNYSHYAYNSVEFGKDSKWLDGLFHKNDGYQTPLVINPMRTKGDIDINNENHLVKSRLIATILRPDKRKGLKFRQLIENYNAVTLKLTLQESKKEKVLYENDYQKQKLTELVSLKNLEIDTEKILMALDKIYPFNFQKLNKKRYAIALDYIIYKLVSIAIKYDEYQPFFSKSQKSFKTEDAQEYLKLLMGDSSHITFKLRQTLNFLRFQHINLKDQQLDIGKLANKVDGIVSKLKRSRQQLRTIDMVPPPIFKIDILLRNELNAKDEIRFEALSSGEKQMIYSVSSLMYHLTNLDSVRRSSQKRTAYKYINILLEEIELYFHPDMQRLYIKHIIDGIENLELGNIRGINITFVTHSPFILSDIPNSNILFLGESGLPNGTTAEVETFAGNIHTLLAHSFFLKNGLIGAFAREKVERCIDQLNGVTIEHQMPPSDLYQTINLIGEPFLRNKLMDMYYELYQNKTDKQAEINRIKLRLKQLES